MKKVVFLALTLLLVLNLFLIGSKVSANSSKYWTPDGCTNYPTYYDDGSIDVKDSDHWSIYKTKVSGTAGFNIDFDADVKASGNTRFFIRRMNPLSYFYFRFWQGDNSLKVSCQLFENDQWHNVTPEKILSAAGPYHISMDVNRETGLFKYVITSLDGSKTYYNESCSLVNISDSFFTETSLQFMIGADDNGCPVSAKFSNFIVENKEPELVVSISGSTTINLGESGEYASVVTHKNQIAKFNWTLEKDGKTVDTKVTQNYSYTFLEEGTYTLSLSVTDAKENTSSEKITIVVFDKDSDITKWTLVSGTTAELDDNQKVMITADNLNGQVKYNSTVYGDSGFNISFNMKILSTDICKTFIYITCESSNIFMRVKADKSSNTLYASMEFWQVSNSTWTPGYRNYSIPKLESDELKISYFHEEGSHSMTWKITSSDESKVYLNETYDSSILPDDDAKDLFNEKMQFALGGEGSGKWIWSNFTGFPYNDKNLHSTPFTCVTYVNETGKLEQWHISLNKMIAKYQKATFKSFIQIIGSKFEADLIIVSFGKNHFNNKIDANEFKKDYQKVIKEIREQNSNAVIVLESISQVTYNYKNDLVRHALYNIAIKELADENEKTVYADTVSSSILASWNNLNDEFRFYGISTALAQSASTFSLSSGTGFPTYGTKFVYSSALKNEQLQSIINATTKESIKEIIDSPDCYLDLDVYNKMDCSQRLDVCELLFEYLKSITDKSSITTKSLNDEFVSLSYEVAYYTSSKTSLINSNNINKIVVVGDSISYGTCCTNPAVNRWVAIVNERIKEATGNSSIIVDTEYSIPGTFLTRVTDNGMYSPAKDIIQTAVIDKAPDMLYIAYGINDLNNGVKYDYYISEFDAYLNKIRVALPNTVVVVVGLTYEGAGSRSSEIQKWNLGYRELADKYNCIYADNYNMLKGSEWLLKDNLHPTDIGYFVMGNAIYSAIATKCNLNNVEISNEILVLEDEIIDNDDNNTTNQITTTPIDSSNDKGNNNRGCKSVLSIDLISVLIISTIGIYAIRKKKEYL